MTTIKTCTRCVLPDSYPDIHFDSNGICNFCNDYQTKSSEEKNHFIDEDDLNQNLKKYKGIHPKYDVLVPLSGGVDSSFTLIELVQKFNLRPLAYHNDHCYEDSAATDNVKKLCKALDVDLIITQQDASFMKKLWKYVGEEDMGGLNSCYICGNILYLYALEIADKYNIKLVINGYSKGQAELTNDKVMGTSMLSKMKEIIRKRQDHDFFNDYMNKYNIVSKLIGYHKRKDLEAEVNHNKILVIPFFIFKFYKTEKEELKKKILEFFDWEPIPSSYPNRTTNCHISWLNSYLDINKQGYSVFEPEYAEMVRVGDMTREQALKDLEFNPPEGLLERLIEEIQIDMDTIQKLKKD